MSLTPVASLCSLLWQDNQITDNNIDSQNKPVYLFSENEPVGVANMGCVILGFFKTARVCLVYLIWNKN